MGQGFGDQHAAAGFENPFGFGEGLVQQGHRHVMQAVEKQNHVGAIRRQGQGFGPGPHITFGADAGGGEGPGELLRAGIDTDHPTDAEPGQVAADMAVAAADIEYDPPGNGQQLRDHVGMLADNRIGRGVAGHRHLSLKVKVDKDSHGKPQQAIKPA